MKESLSAGIVEFTSEKQYKANICCFDNDYWTLSSVRHFYDIISDITNSGLV